MKVAAMEVTKVKRAIPEFKPDPFLWIIKNQNPAR
jgi:hypothetical protein